MVQDEIYVAKRVNEHVPKNRWIASLSNGETIFEDRTPGMEAAWNRLAKYVKQNRLAITNLRVQIGAYEVTLPKNQEGYIQKKRAMATNSWSATSLCIGYIQGDKCLIHYLGSDLSSETNIENDPGPPFSIYRHDIECAKSCCIQS